VSNQTILWSTIILPWLTLFLMNKNDVKRYMPVALLGALITTIVGEFALALNWWSTKEVIFPFYHVQPMSYGGFLVGTIWIFKFTYRRGFMSYMLANAVFDFLLPFGINRWMSQLGIMELVNITPLKLMMINLADAVVLYGYQMWQDDVLVTSTEKKNQFSSNLQPAVAKPLPQKQDDNNSE